MKTLRLIAIVIVLITGTGFSQTCTSKSTDTVGKHGQAISFQIKGLSWSYCPGNKHLVLSNDGPKDLFIRFTVVNSKSSTVHTGTVLSGRAQNFQVEEEPSSVVLTDWVMYTKAR